jgi:hypothetical protein
MSINPLLKECEANKKTCFFQPEDCLTKPGYLLNTSCSVGVTVTKGDEDGTADVELFTHNGPMEGVDTSAYGVFVAFGLSYDKWMGDDSVMSCAWGPTAVTAKNPRLNLGYNTGKHHGGDYTNNNAFNQTAKIINDTTIYCKFTRKIIADNSADSQYVYPLNERYYFLITRGVANPNTTSLYVHSLSDGDNFPFISKTKYYPITPGNPATYSFVSGDHGWASKVSRDTQYKLVYAHGGLMMLGFWVFIGTGIIFGRYYKVFFPANPQIGNLALWFQLHRAIQVIGVLLICTSFICIFVSTGHLVDKDMGSTYQHMVLGMTSVILVILMPLSAIARPKPSSPYRPLFKDFHFFFGFTSVALAFGAFILAATDMSKGGLTKDPKNVNLMYAVVGILGFINIFQTIYMRLYQAEKEKQDSTTLTEKIIAFERPHLFAPWTWGLHLMTLIYVVSTFGISVYLTKKQADAGVETLGDKFP